MQHAIAVIQTKLNDIGVLTKFPGGIKEIHLMSDDAFPWLSNLDPALESLRIIHKRRTWGVGTVALKFVIFGMKI